MCVISQGWRHGQALPWLSTTSAFPASLRVALGDVPTFQKRSLVPMETQTEVCDPTAAGQQLQPTAPGQGRSKQALPTAKNFI